MYVRVVNCTPYDTHYFIYSLHGSCTRLFAAWVQCSGRKGNGLMRAVGGWVGAELRKRKKTFQEDATWHGRSRLRRRM